MLLMHHHAAWLFSVLLSIPLQNVEAVTDSALIAHWSFDTESMQAEDLSGHGHVADFKGGAVHVAGIRGMAAQLGGNGQYLQIEGAPDLSGMANLTIEMWVRLTGHSTYTGLLSLWGPQGFVDDAYAIGIQRDDSWGFAVSGGMGFEDKFKTTTSPLLLGRWTFITAVYSGDSTYLFQDGSLIVSGTSIKKNIQGVDSSQSLLIGCYPLETTKSQSMDVDEIRILNRALTATEILKRFQEFTLIPDTIPPPPLGTSKKSPPMATWNFEDTTGNGWVADITGNGHTGKIWNAIHRIPGVRGQGLKLDGKSNYIRVDNTVGLSGMKQVSIDMWMRLNAHSTYTGAISLWGPGGTVDDSYAIGIQRDDSWGWAISAGNGEEDKNKVTGSPMNLGQWYYLTAVYNGDSAFLYQDGKQLVAGPSIHSPIQYVGAPLFIGSYPKETGNTLNMDVDEINVWDRALTAEEIKQRFDSIPKTAPTPPPETTHGDKPIRFGCRGTRVLPGADFSIPVFLSNYSGILLDAAQFTAFLDSTFVEFKGMSTLEGLAKNWSCQVQNIPTVSTQIQVSCAGSPIVIGEGEFVRFHFKAKPNIENHQTSFSLRNIQINYDANTSILTDSAIISARQSIYYGDVDGDKEVTQSDAQKILLYASGLLPLSDLNSPDFTEPIADVSGNGKVTALDAALVLEHAVGRLSVFPSETMQPLRKRSAASPPAILSFGPIRPVENGYLEFEILGKGIQGLRGGQLDFQLDTALIAEMGETLSSAKFVHLGIRTDSNQIFHLSYASVNSPAEGNVPLLSVRFKPKSGQTALGSIPLTFVSAVFNEGEIPISWQSTSALGSDPIPTKIKPESPLRRTQRGLFIENPNHYPWKLELYDVSGHRLAIQSGHESGLIPSSHFNAFEILFYRLALGTNRHLGRIQSLK